MSDSVDARDTSLQDGRNVAKGSAGRTARSRRKPGGDALGSANGKSDNSLLLAVPHLLHRAAQRADGHVDRRLSPFQLTSRQFLVLDDIEHNPGLSQIQLGAHTGVDRSTLVNIIDRLQSRGLVVRTKSKIDRRAVALQLTDTGRAALEFARPLVRDVHQHLLSLIPEDQRSLFLSNLAILIAAKP